MFQSSGNVASTLRLQITEGFAGRCVTSPGAAGGMASPPHFTPPVSFITRPHCEGGRQAQEEGDMRIHIADSLCCTAETNTTL